MAEGWLRHLFPDLFEVASAGITTHGLNPLAVKIMAEAGVDISDHYSKTTEELSGLEFNYVITVCGHADEHCPFFPASTRVIHHGFDDPPALAKDASSDEEILCHYRRVRDEIRDFVQKISGRLKLKLQARIFSKLFEQAEIANFSDDEYAKYEDSLKSYRDLKNSIDTAFDEGRIEGKMEGKLEGKIEGRIEGRMEGKVAGRKEEKVETAKLMKKKGYTLSNISDITGLSTDEIDAL